MYKQQTINDKHKKQTNKNNLFLIIWQLKTIINLDEDKCKKKSILVTALTN